MSVLNDIFDELGLKHPAPGLSTPPKPTAPAAPPSGSPLPPGVQFLVTPPPTSPQAPAPVVDVTGQLEKLAASRSRERLDWKVSIVDLLKLLGIDSSYENRKELATELGCPAEKMGDSAQMNMWLHKSVLQKIAENGGNVPPALLD